jgi:hypothetical protein
VSVGDDPPQRRMQFRLWQISITSVTVLLTAWSYTLHVALGLTATFLAKHVLVAVLAAGLQLPPLHERE